MSLCIYIGKLIPTVTVTQLEGASHVPIAPHQPHHVTSLSSDPIAERPPWTRPKAGQ